jgi:prolipoprotein diacylglyceryltransferase
MVALLLYSKYVSHRSLLWVLDRVVVPTALVAALIRTGNLMNSEIYGIQTSLPWGFIFDRNGETVAKHPTQIYEALSYLFGFGLLMYMYWKTKAKDKQGMLLGVFFIITFLSRFLIEFIKEDQEAFEATMSLNMGQWLSIPFVIAGIILVAVAYRKPPVVYS